MIQSNAGSRIDVRPWLIKSKPFPATENQASWIFYFDFIIDTILLYFFNGYGSIRYVDVFRFMSYIKKVLMHKIYILLLSTRIG
jgi:hypothetical protein